MRNKIGLFLTVMCVYIAEIYAQAPSNFEVKGYINNLDNPATAYLVRDVRSLRPITDSITIENGHFQFSGEVEEPVKAYLAINHKSSSIRGIRDVLEFFLEPGKLTLEKVDSISQVRFEKGSVNGDYQAFQQKVKSSASKQEVCMEFVEKHADHVSALEALYQYGGSNPDVAKMEPLFLLLTESVRETSAGRGYEQRLAHAKTTAPGREAPNFTQQTPDGESISLTDFRGQYVLVDFWASWCKPCREENPHVVAAYEKYKVRGFTVLGVSLDNEKGRDAWIKAIADDGLTWTQVSDLKGWKNEASQLFGVRAIPQNFLIDPNGVIIATNLRGEELMKKLEEMFK